MVPSKALKNNDYIQSPSFQELERILTVRKLKDVLSESRTGLSVG